MRRVALLACGLLLVGGAAGAFAQEPVGLDVTASPRTLVFGDQLQVRADVLVDRDLADPSSVQIDAEPRPFEVSRMRRETELGSGLARVRFAIALSCLRPRCLPPEGEDERVLDLPPLRVRFEGEDAERTLEAPLPRVRIRARLSPGQVRERDAWSYDDRALAPASPTVSPGLATGLLGAAAAVLALLSAALAVYAGTGRTPRGALAGRRRTPLERALALTQRAASRQPEERRKALERLGRELARAGQSDLAARSDSLAWSRPEPSTSAIGALAADVERVIAGAGR